jgi:hypothetical protein
MKRGIQAIRETGAQKPGFLEMSYDFNLKDYICFWS